jgi:phosphopantetheinyl transferase (holo-ACP synthase)
MEDEIKKIYTKLSGGKVIDGDGYVIGSGHFSSILRDRFIAELSKLGVRWDGKEIGFAELIGARAVGELPANRAAEASKSQPGAERLPVAGAGPKNADFAIGIDIQQTAELPDCTDYWEDEFYKMKFTPEEIAYGVSKENPKETFAGIYSCKEALVKCNNALDWNSIAITYDPDGRPQFADYHLSISHSGGNAVAIAIHQKAGYRSGHNGVAPEREKVTADVVEVSRSEVKQHSPKSVKLLFFLLTVVILYLIYRDFIR